jgi:NAD(P)H dehydrogenase (quinone)
MPEAPKIAVIYYSATGTVYELARSISAGAEAAGAQVRLRKAAELAPESAIASNPAWAKNAAATRDIAVATPDDAVWADAIIFGSPTRFGNIASQLKQYIDTLGGLWAQGTLANKAYSGFTASSTAHGGQESTLLALYHSVHHFGGILVAPGPLRNQPRQRTRQHPGRRNRPQRRQIPGQPRRHDHGHAHPRIDVVTPQPAFPIS